MELYYEIASKWDVDAVLMGSNTVLTGFNAESGEIREENVKALKLRDKNPEDPRPFLVVPDSSGSIRIWYELFQMPYLRDIIVLCSESTPQDYLDFLDERKIDYIISGKEKVDFKNAILNLSSIYGLKSIRVDSGGILNGILLRTGLVDEIHVLIHPELVGGTTLNSIFIGEDLESLDDTIKVKLLDINKLKEHIVWLKYKIVR